MDSSISRVLEIVMDGSTSRIHQSRHGMDGILQGFIRVVMDRGTLRIYQSCQAC